MHAGVALPSSDHCSDHMWSLYEDEVQLRTNQGMFPEGDEAKMDLEVG